jgi:hypothetical protein
LEEECIIFEQTKMKYNLNLFFSEYLFQFIQYSHHPILRQK